MRSNTRDCDGGDLHPLSLHDKLRTMVFGRDGVAVATMLLNLAGIKDSCAPYQQEYAGLYA